MSPRLYVPPSVEEGTAWSPSRFSPDTELTASGMSTAVAAEVERRITVVSQEEASGDDSRQPLSGGELLGYILTCLLLCGLGALVVVL